MITDVEYMQIVNEYYDLSDYNTKRKVLFCNEAAKSSNLEHITNELYNQIKNDITAIDFGSIPRSKGVISKIDNYQTLIDCINTIRELILEYNDDTKIVDEISTAIGNIQKRERDFTKAFALNIDFPMMTYNTMTLACVSSISLIISSSIEFIKNGHDSFSMSFDKAAYKKTRNHLLYQTIQQFNRICSDGSLDKMLAYCIKNNLSESAVLNELSSDNLKDVADMIYKLGVGGTAGFLATQASSTIAKIALGAVGAGYGIIAFLLLSRYLIFWFGRQKIRIGEWFETQATLLQINAENLKYRDDPDGDDHKKKVYQKQMKWVDKFRKISNKLLLSDSKASSDTDKKVNDDRKNHKNDDNQDDDDSLF